MNRNLNYFWVSLKIKFKQMFEYKTNSYFALIINSLWMLTFALILNIFYTNFGDLLGWTFKEYLFYYFFSNFAIVFGGIFWYGSNLASYLIGGVINSYLTRPINIFVQYFSNGLVLFIISNFILYGTGVLVFLYLYFDEISIFRFILLLFFILIVGIAEVSFMRLIDSFAFFFKENHFLIRYYESINGTFVQFPSSSFKNWIGTFAMVFPIFFYGIFSTNFLFGRVDFLLFYKVHLYLIIFSIICIFIIIVMWKIGLKKYEGFN